jgi:ferredoxin-NADP reductase
MNTMTTPSPAGSAESNRHALIDVVLSDVEHAARDTNAYTFRRPDGGKLPAYKAGAHIDIHLPNGLIRQFSLLNPSADPDSYVVGI